MSEHIDNQMLSSNTNHYDNPISYNAAPIKEPTSAPKTLPNSYDTIDLDFSDIENDPKGFFSKIYDTISNFFNWITGNGTTPPVETTTPKKPTSKTWIEDEIAELRALIEADGLHIDNYIHKLAQLTSLSFFNSGQIELDEIKALYENLKRMLQDQKGHYNSNKVFATDILNGCFGVVGGVFCLAGPNIGTAIQTMSQGGQSASKIFGNSVERDKTSIQHLIEHLKQQIEQTRTHRAGLDQQTNKMEDHRSQAHQMRQQIVGELTR